jgi:hypothetical protein
MHKMMNGEPFDPAVFDEADAARQKSLRDTADLLNHLPPGTSLTLPIGDIGKSKMKACRK